MDRQIVYPGQIPLETDLLNTNRNTMIALGKLIGALLGTGGVVNGLAVGPNTPAALNVVVAAGEAYQLANVDNSAYSSIPADTTDTCVKQGILLQPATLACPAPGTAGFSINYLIEAIFTEADAAPVVLPYYNASNPSQAYSGPANSGAQQATVRAGQVTLQAKAGAAATTGTQTTPAVDAGYVALAVVTVANGQTTITAGNIAAVASNSVLTSSLLAQLQNVPLKAGHGQCRLSVASGTTLALKPYNGQNLVINGAVQQIPSAGVTITNAGLTAATLYYVYAAVVAGAVVLELSTTGHTQATNGIETKSGDVTRTLVGMAYTDTGSVFADSQSKRYCLNWFNRRAITAAISGGPFTTNSSSTSEVSATLRMNFLSWSDESTRANYGGSVSNTVAGGAASTYMITEFDGTNSGANFVVASPFAGFGVGFNVEANLALSEGFHFASLYWNTNGSGTSTVNTTGWATVRG